MLLITQTHEESTLAAKREGGGLVDEEVVVPLIGTIDFPEKDVEMSTPSPSHV